MDEWIGAIVDIAAGLAVLLLGGELLVRGASQLAAIARIPPLVVGLTVVAFGTSSPELAVSVESAMSGNADIALGNVVGSNIFNVLFILGTSALLVPMVVSSRLVRLDVPLMIAASLSVLLLGLDRQISRVDGAILFAVLCWYIGWCIHSARRERSIADDKTADIALAASTDNRGRLMLPIVLILVGLGLLVFGAQQLVAGAVDVATRLQVSELVIGLTIVSVGTSMPEVVTLIVSLSRSLLCGSERSTAE